MKFNIRSLVQSAITYLGLGPALTNPPQNPAQLDYRPLVDLLTQPAGPRGTPQFTKAGPGRKHQQGNTAKQADERAQRKREAGGFGRGLQNHFNKQRSLSANPLSPFA